MLCFPTKSFCFEEKITMFAQSLRYLYKGMKTLRFVLWSLLLLLSLSGSLYAAEGVKNLALVLKFTDETTTEFRLATKPEITFSIDKLVVTSEAMSGEYDRSKVVEFYFAEATNAIGENEMSKTVITYLDNRHVVVAGISATEVLLYDMNGASLNRYSVEGGEVTIDLGEYASGVYLLNFANNQTIKLIRK